MQEGINRVTMRRIASSIEYAPTVLYRLFANKADLMDHLIARGYNGVREGYDVILERRDLDSKARLEGILTTYIDYALSHPSHYSMWFDSGSIYCHGQQLRMTHGRLKFIVFQVWLDCIEACQQDGQFAKWTSLDVFQILWSRVHGLISLRLQHPDLPWMPVTRQLQEVLILSST